MSVPGERILIKDLKKGDKLEYMAYDCACDEQTAWRAVEVTSVTHNNQKCWSVLVHDNLVGKPDMRCAFRLSQEDVDRRVRRPLPPARKAKFQINADVQVFLEKRFVDDDGAATLYSGWYDARVAAFSHTDGTYTLFMASGEIRNLLAEDKIRLRPTEADRIKEAVAEAVEKETKALRAQRDQLEKDLASEQLSRQTLRDEGRKVVAEYRSQGSFSFLQLLEEIEARDRYRAERDKATSEVACLQEDLKHVRSTLAKARATLVKGGAWGNESLEEAAKRVCDERECLRAQLEQSEKKTKELEHRVQVAEIKLLSYDAKPTSDKAYHLFGWDSSPPRHEGADPHVRLDLRRYPVKQWHDNGVDIARPEDVSLTIALDDNTVHTLRRIVGADSKAIDQLERDLKGTRMSLDAQLSLSKELAAKVAKMKEVLK